MACNSPSQSNPKGYAPIKNSQSTSDTSQPTFSSYSQQKVRTWLLWVLPQGLWTFFWTEYEYSCTALEFCSAWERLIGICRGRWIFVLRTIKVVHGSRRGRSWVWSFPWGTNSYFRRWILFAFLFIVRWCLIGRHKDRFLLRVLRSFWGLLFSSRPFSSNMKTCDRVL